MPGLSPPSPPLPTPWYPTPPPSLGAVPAVLLGLLVSPLWGGACGVRHLLGRAGTPAHFPSLCPSVGSAPACQQAEAAILLTRRMLCMLYTGILTAICQWLHCHPYCDCFCTRSSGFPFFRCRRCLCRRGIAVAQVHSLSIALTPGACSPPCLGGGRPAPTEAIKDNHDKVALHVKCRKSGERAPTKTNPSDSRRCENAMSMSIPPSEHEECHQDRGPNQLDP